MKHICDKVPEDMEVSYIWKRWCIIQWELSPYAIAEGTPRIVRLFDIVYCPYCGKRLEEELEWD